MRQEPLSFLGEEEKGLQEGLKQSWWQCTLRGCSVGLCLPQILGWGSGMGLWP